MGNYYLFYILQREVRKFTILWLEWAIKQAQNHQERSAWVVAAALPPH